MTDPIFDHPAPARPPGKPRVTIPVGGVTVKAQCPACDMVTTQSVDWRGSLCGDCRARLPELIRELTAVIGALDAEGESAVADFERLIGSLPVTLGDRFAVLQQTFERSREAYEKAQTTAKAYQTDADVLANLREARDAFAAVQDKIARSAQNPQNELSPVILAWQSMMRDGKTAQELLVRRRVALQMAQDLQTDSDLPF